MKTTLELPDELMRAVKIRAAREGRKLKDVMADLIRGGLSATPETAGAAPKKVRIPLVQCVHEAHPEDEMTPDRVAEVLLQEDARTVRHWS